MSSHQKHVPVIRMLEEELRMQRWMLTQISKGYELTPTNKKVTDSILSNFNEAL